MTTDRLVMEGRVSKRVGRESLLSEATSQRAWKVAFSEHSESPLENYIHILKGLLWLLGQVRFPLFRICMAHCFFHPFTFTLTILF